MVVLTGKTSWRVVQRAGEAQVTIMAMTMQYIKSMLVAIFATFLLIAQGYVAHGATSEAQITSPLDIGLTKEWDQLIAEVWVGVSTGRMPASRASYSRKTMKVLSMGMWIHLKWRLPQTRSTTDVRELSSTKQIEKSSMDGDEFLGKTSVVKPCGKS